VRGVRALSLASLTLRTAQDDEPSKRSWEKAPRRGCWPPRCFVLFSFYDPDLVCSQLGEMTLGPRILKLKGVLDLSC